MGEQRIYGRGEGSVGQAWAAAQHVIADQRFSAESKLLTIRDYAISALGLEDDHWAVEELVAEVDRLKDEITELRVWREGREHEAPSPGNYVSLVANNADLRSEVDRLTRELDKAGVPQFDDNGVPIGGALRVALLADRAESAERLAGELAEAVDDYLLWEPGRKGHAHAGRQLRAALDYYRAQRAPAHGDAGQDGERG